MFAKTKTVETITARLKDIVTELQGHAGTQSGEGDRKRAEADRLQAEATAHQIESDRALKVASNITALLT